MGFGALSGVYPGKHFTTAQSQKGLQGVNRERLQADVENIQALGSQLFTSSAAASEQESVLAVEQLQTRLATDTNSLLETGETLRLDILA
jgi:hypothetical protein